MRTRTIVALMVAGAALLFGPGLVEGGGPTPEAQRSSTTGESTTTAPPTSTRSAAAPTTVVVPTSTSSTSTTIPPAELKRQLAGVDLLERVQPLTQRLPHDSPHFNIDYRVGADWSLTLQITLRAVLNRADQLDQYRDQLRAYKAEALEWLRSVGADPGALRIEYLPPEAARL